jgi:3-oxoacyl-[acyl-carrier-protein] synthase-3
VVTPAQVAIPVGIRAIGTFTPERVVDNAELAEVLDTSDEWIRKHVGIATRVIAAADQWSSDLGARALLDACERAEVRPESLDLVICGTYTPDTSLPPTASIIMNKAGIRDVPGFDINAGGCPGSVFALDIGARYVASGGYRRVAVVLTDVTSRVLDPADRSTRVIFGDAAACYLLEPLLPDRAGVGTALLGTSPQKSAAVHVVRQRRAEPSGFGDLYMDMVGREVRAFVLSTVPAFIRTLLLREGLQPDDVDFYALHQPNLHLVHHILDALGQPWTKTLTHVERLGNVSGASVPMALREAVDTGALKPGDRVVAAAFGAGVSYGAVVLRWPAAEDFR